MFPGEFSERLRRQDYIDAESLLRALGEPSPVSIRINTPKWRRKPANAEPVPWASDSWYLGIRPSFTLDPLFHSGCYYPQEASGMFLEEVIRQSVPVTDGIKALDLCGAPGGKSTLISDLLGSNSLLISNEVIRLRASVLAETVTKWGNGNTIVTNSDPSSFKKLTGFFDLVFVDAPCSGEGMFRNNVAVSEWSLSNTALCAERQRRILMDVWPSLKESGILIYSTCTFNPDENERNIKWLISQHQPECLKIDISRYQGIREIDYQGIYGYGFYPDKVRGEGFFISAIRKKAGESKSRRPGQMTMMKPASKERDAASKWYGHGPGRLARNGDEVIALHCDPEDYASIAGCLKIIKPGTRILTVKKNDFLPGHELALSRFMKNDAFPAAELKLRDALSMLRRDNFTIGSTEKGWIAARYNGVNIGFVKNLGNRINNYFPVEWRIRMNLPPGGSENILEWE